MAWRVTGQGAWRCGDARRGDEQHHTPLAGWFARAWSRSTG